MVTYIAEYIAVGSVDAPKPWQRRLAVAEIVQPSSWGACSPWGPWSARQQPRKPPQGGMEKFVEGWAAAAAKTAAVQCCKLSVVVPAMALCWAVEVVDETMKGAFALGRPAAAFRVGVLGSGLAGRQLAEGAAGPSSVQWGGWRVRPPPTGHAAVAAAPGEQ